MAEATHLERVLSTLRFNRIMGEKKREIEEGEKVGYDAVKERLQ